jgi:hypothetical protein
VTEAERSIREVSAVGRSVVALAREAGEIYQAIAAHVSAGIVEPFDALALEAAKCGDAARLTDAEALSSMRAGLEKMLKALEMFVPASRDMRGLVVALEQRIGIVA